MKSFIHAQLLIIITLLFGTTSAICHTHPSDLKIITPTKSVIITKSKLLTHAALKEVIIKNDRAYPNKTMHHQAIPLCQLLAPYKISKTDIIELIAHDQFHVYVPAHKIMNCYQNSSIAMLAIEPFSKWPIINNHTGKTAGPYEIIWLHPERAYISNEYWAWSVIAIKITHHLDYKHVLPPPDITNASIRNGYQLYISHCEGCHAINHVGKSDIGPDLNCPKNPLEYYPDIRRLKKFIRNPQSVRYLSQGRMSGSDVESLTESDLNDLITFFGHMKTKKRC